jgi:hypothetical protein
MECTCDSPFRLFKCPASEHKCTHRIHLSDTIKDILNDGNCRAALHNYDCLCGYIYTHPVHSFPCKTQGRHYCICNLNQALCHATRHLCRCEQEDQCRRAKDHVCVCLRRGPSRCRSRQCPCICPSAECRALLCVCICRTNSANALCRAREHTCCCRLVVPVDSLPTVDASGCRVPPDGIHAYYTECIHPPPYEK